MPYLLRVANNEYNSLKVFGNDYSTRDGSAERDYIHVVDLANAHVLAILNIKEGIHTFNVGTGKSTSVLELIDIFEKVNNIKIKYDIVERREGDVAVSYCECDKINNEIGWKAEHSIEDMCKDAWNFISQLNKIKYFHLQKLNILEKIVLLDGSTSCFSVSVSVKIVLMSSLLLCSLLA